MKGESSEDGNAYKLATEQEEGREQSKGHSGKVRRMSALYITY